MPFRYRLQKVLEFRIRKKEEQLQEVLKAKNEVDKAQQRIDENNAEIQGVIHTMRTNPDYRMMESHDKYLKHLYEKGEILQEEKRQAEERLEHEKQKLIECEKEVKVLDPKGEYQGVALGINDKGELLVQKADGTVEEVYAGEVSVRGLWGYV